MHLFYLCVSRSEDNLQELFSLSACRSWDLNSGHQDRQQLPESAEPLHWPYFLKVIKILDSFGRQRNKLSGLKEWVSYPETNRQIQILIYLIPVTDQNKLKAPVSSFQVRSGTLCSWQCPLRICLSTPENTTVDLYRNLHNQQEIIS